MKQMGSNFVMDGRCVRLRDKSGADPSEWPKELRAQMFPGEAWA